MTQFVPRIWPKVVIFGDSITQFGFSSEGGWISLLSDALQRKCDVLARGFSGYNTRMCRAVMPRLFSKENLQGCQAFLLFLGPNDSSLPFNTQQHVPRPEFEQNLTEMIKQLATFGVSRDKVILISPPPIYEPDWEVFCKQKGGKLNRLNANTGLYVESCMKVAKDTGCEAVNIYSAMMSSKSDWQSYLCDGLHLSASGSQFLFSLVNPLVQLRTASLPSVVFPLWDTMSNTDPESSLDLWLNENIGAADSDDRLNANKTDGDK